MNHLPSQLSGGQRQRVAVARALANNPALILADEPTGNLDTAAGNDLMGLIRELNQSQGTTFLVVTHDLNVARQTRRVIVMADGKIAREDWIGSPIEEDLKVWSALRIGQAHPGQRCRLPGRTGDQPRANGDSARDFRPEYRRSSRHASQLSTGILSSSIGGGYKI